jgi:branched-chain amino acid transport system substrate-binding protein
MSEKKNNESILGRFDNVTRLAACVICLTCIAVLTVSAGGKSDVSKEEAAPIKLAMLQPLEGECAPWGIPIVRGAQIWADEHNATGGILCGDGKRHLVELSAYTNVCYYPNEELKAAKKAIYEDKAGFLFQTYTPSCRKALVSLLNSEKVLSLSYGAGYLSKDCPYLVGCVTGLPTVYMGMLVHLVEIHPEVERVAIMVTNNSCGTSGQWNYLAACEVLKEKVEVVFNETVDEETKDFFPVLSTLLEKKPDVICHMGLPPGPLAILMETALQLGYNGYWLNESWSLEHLLTRVTAEQLEGKLFSAWAADASVPGQHSRLDTMYKTYIERYGQQEWIVDASATYVSLCILEPALAAAPSIDPTTVMETMYGLTEVEHPIFGKSGWGGKEIFGADHHLLTPYPIYVVKGGRHTVSGVFEFAPWWQQNKNVAIEILKKGGQTF